MKEKDVVKEEVAKGPKFKHGKLVVKARPEKGFRRAGINFSSKEDTVFEANSLTEETYEAVTTEPQLVVVESK